jgi:hypothetical protein
MCTISFPTNATSTSQKFEHNFVSTHITINSGHKQTSLLSQYYSVQYRRYYIIVVIQIIPFPFVWHMIQGCISMTSVPNNSWITFRIYSWSLCYAALAAGWRALESFFLIQFTTMLDPPPTGTRTKAIWMLMVVLPMPDLLNASNRAFKMAAITFRGW